MFKKRQAILFFIIAASLSSHSLFARNDFDVQGTIENSIKKIMDKKFIFTDQAPQPIGCYSQAVKIGDALYLSGQIGLDPVTMTLVDGGIEKQAQQAFQNMKAVITAAGFNISDVVKLTIYLADMNDFPIANQVMSQYFSEPYPARSTVEVSKLPKGAMIEVEGIIQGAPKI